MRDRKVEELKKCLSKQVTELPTLNQRKEYYMQGDEQSEDKQPGSCKKIPLLLLNLLCDYFDYFSVQPATLPCWR